VANARAGLAPFAKRAGVPTSTLEAVGLAVSDAAPNVVAHAFSEPGEDARVEVDATVEEGDLVVSVTDRGTESNGQAGPRTRSRRHRPARRQGRDASGEERRQRLLMRFALAAPASPAR
jgi:anti-sigma regulatory factor (Ser/Thr protein kinase)